jgi:hypothetical protein
MQTAGAQLALFPQLPLASHVCCVVPLRQRFAPGAQSAHTLPIQAPDVHGELAPQLPFMSQVCTVVAPEQRVSPGAQTVQVLSMQTPGAQA